MKVRSVTPILLSAPYGTPQDTELKKFYPLGLRSAAFVRVETEDGITGLGECYAGVFMPELVVQLVNFLGEKLVGYDAFNVAQLQAMMTRATSYWGYTGFAKNVISAIEIALWDAKGKALNVPVYELLGGAQTEEFELYASGGLGKSLDDLASELKDYVARGFTCVKIRDRHFEVAPAERSREAIGDKIKLIVDTNQSFMPQSARYNQALAYAKRLAEYDVYFLEEPLAVDDLAGYSRLVKNSPLPISGGETLNSAALFRHHIDSEAFDIIQPDATVIGGIWECFEALSYAKARGREGVCHAYGAAVCQAANAHAAFAAGSTLFEWAMPPNPLRDELLVEPWRIVGGKLQKPTLPGLGVELTGETEEKYRFVPGTNNPGNFR